jgi:catechol 2,3-dioxygenase-like lactoylglutathione lyase family enzyme
VSGSLVHIGIGVSDIKHAENFYVGVFGCVRDRELRMTSDQLGLLQLQPASDIHAVYLLLGNVTLELMAFDPPNAKTAGARVFNQTGLVHLSIAVENIAATCALAAAHGGTVLSQSERAAILRDPDGQLIELLVSAVNDAIEQGRAKRAASRT